MDCSDITYVRVRRDGRFWYDLIEQCTRLQLQYGAACTKSMLLLMHVVLDCPVLSLQEQESGCNLSQ